MVAVEKRRSDGQDLPKQRRDNFMDIDELMSKAPVVRPTMVKSKPRRKKID